MVSRQQALGRSRSDRFLTDLDIHQTPWIDFEESIYRYRVQGMVFAEREALLPGSGDFGAGFFTSLPRDYGEIQAGVYNGEGFGQSEVNKYKSFQSRLTIRPFPKQGLAHGLRLSGFYDLGWYDRDRPRRHGILAGSYEHEHVVVMLQGVSARERPSALLTSTIRRVGYSTFVEMREGCRGGPGCFASSHNRDEALFDDSHRRTIAGVAYWLLWKPRTRRPAGQRRGRPLRRRRRAAEREPLVVPDARRVLAVPDCR